MSTKLSERSTHDAEEDSRNQDVKLYLNGEILHRDEAKVSIYDAGFMLGDGVWEGLRIYNGHFAFIDEHINRLFEAAYAIDLSIGLSKSEIKSALYQVAEANNMSNNAHARLMVTRGIKSKPFQDPRLSKQGPTIAIIIEHSTPTASLQGPGIRLHTVPHYRGLPMTQDPKLNSHSKLNCILAGIHAQKAGADEALMLDPQGFVNTTNSCNFFIVKNNQVWTSTGDYCMNGITRQKVIDLCIKNDIPVFQRHYSLVETYSAEEAFITGTFGAQTQVNAIDGRQIGTGLAGPITRKIQQLYKTLVQQHTMH